MFTILYTEHVGVREIKRPDIGTVNIDTLMTCTFVFLEWAEWLNNVSQM